MYADDTQNNHCIYRHYRLLFRVEIVNILYTMQALEAQTVAGVGNIRDVELHPRTVGNADF